MRAARELPGRLRPRRERLIRHLPLWLAGAAAVALGVAALIGAGAGYKRVLSSLRSADPAWLAVAVLFELLAYLGYALAFRASTRVGGGPQLPLGRAARLVVASVGATRLMLGGGPAYLYWMLRDSGLNRAGALTRLAALNALLFGLLAGGAWVAALVVLAGSDGAARVLALPWLIGAAAAAGACAVAYALLRRTARVVAVTNLLLRRPARHLDAYAGAVLYWAGDILCLWSALQALGAAPGAPEVLLAYASAYLATMLPLPLGGAGGGEAAIALTLSAVGVPLAPALLGALGYRLVSFWLPTPAGIALLLSTKPAGLLVGETTEVPAARRGRGSRHRRAGLDSR